VKPEVLIAGSGLAGLACACKIASIARVTVFDRLPVVGGEDWREPEIQAHAEIARERGVAFEMASTVLRWNGERALVLGQSQGSFLGQILVVATGHRPMTKAELKISGAPCGGVLPATVAGHLMSMRVLPGRNPVVYGDGEKAVNLCKTLAKMGAEPTLLVPEDGTAPTKSHFRVIANMRLISIEGDSRIRRVVVGDRDNNVTLEACDALILAHGRLPYRNISGAIYPTETVVLAQNPIDQNSGGSDRGVAIGETAAIQVAETLATSNHSSPRGAAR
jgi:thioredoxin reductase